jgi:hypothetical protein
MPILFSQKRDRSLQTSKFLVNGEQIAFNFILLFNPAFQDKITWASDLLKCIFSKMVVVLLLAIVVG